MKVASTLKLKLAETFYVDSFVVLFDEWEHVPFLKNMIKQNMIKLFQIILYTLSNLCDSTKIQQIWSNKFDCVLLAIADRLIRLTNSW